MGRWWFENVQRRINWRFARRAKRVHGRGALLVAVGDSHTDPTSAYTLPRQIWLRRFSRAGYRTVNLGVSGDTTAQMRRRIDQVLCQGQPEIVVLFGGGNDALRGVEPAETERDVTFMVEWLQERGIRKIVLIGPGVLNGNADPDWRPAADDVGAIMSDVAARHEAVYVDLAEFLRDRIARGEDPDFSRTPYRQRRSWHVFAGDAHFNAYGQRLIAEALQAAIADWRPRTTRGRST